MQEPLEQEVQKVSFGQVLASLRSWTVITSNGVIFKGKELYEEEDAKQRIPKAVVAKRRLNQINTDVEIQAFVQDASASEIEAFVKDVDLIVDATDNFDTRMILNDISQKYQKPWIYGACVGSYGISYTIIPGKTPCLNCLLDSVPIGGLTCDTAGIISPTVQMVVAYQVSEGLKILVEDYESLRKKLVSFDLWSNQHTSISVDKLKKANCPSCGQKPIYPYLDYRNQTKTALLCGRDSVQIRPPSPVELDLEKLAQTLSKLDGKVERNPYLVSFIVGNHRLVMFKDGRALIHGTKEIEVAKTLYYRYFG